MTATISPPHEHTASHTFGGVLLDGISWNTYKRLRAELDDSGQNVRVTYDRGRMALMSPRPEHEKWKMMIGAMLDVLALERRIPMSRLGSTTWRRDKNQRGLEADQCYYVQHERQVRGRTDLDLKRDPPPDWAIEIELTHHPLDRQSIFADLGIPELWRFDGERVTTLHLAGGKYHPADVSLAFPFLRPAELERFVALLTSKDETSILLAFRDWVRSVPV
jgi:Uma2 family endonuclease